MNSRYIEQRNLQTADSLTRDVARHLYARYLCGPAVVVTDRPGIAMPSVKKQWRGVERRATRERASTLMAGRIAGLSRLVSYMQRTRFATHPTEKPTGPAVLFMTREQLLASQPSCRTLYLTDRAEESDLAILGRSVDRHGVIVTYHR